MAFFSTLRIQEVETSRFSQLIHLVVFVKKRWYIYIVVVLVLVLKWMMKKGRIGREKKEIFCDES